MEQVKYITISEFARRAGLTRQTVYRKIDKELSQFCVTQDNKKLISEEAIEFLSADGQQHEAKCYKMDINHTSNIDVVTALQNTIQTLQEQIKIKDSQIDKLITSLMKSCDKNTEEPKPKNFLKRLLGGKKQ